MRPFLSRPAMLALALMPALFAAPLSAAPVPHAAAPSRTEEMTELYDFRYDWPAAAAAIGPLDTALARLRAQARDTLIAQAREDRELAGQEGYPYRPHVSHTGWSSVTNLPGHISLMAEIYVFGGGAHGMSGFDSMVWDKAASRPIAPWDMFVHPRIFSASFAKAFCAALNRERAKRRQGHDMGVMFNDCPDITQQTLILGSSDRRHFNRIGLLLAPYVAGPYAEGTYEISLPMTPAMLAAVKPAYRPLFAAAK